MSLNPISSQSLTVFIYLFIPSRVLLEEFSRRMDKARQTVTVVVVVVGIRMIYYSQAVSSPLNRNLNDNEPGGR